MLSRHHLFHRLALKGLALGALALGLTSSVMAQTDTGGTAGSVVVKGDLKPRKAGTWTRAESQHFVIISDRSQRDISGLLNRLERFDYVLKSYVGANPDIDNGRPKQEIYYLAREQDIDQIDPATPEFAIGLYRSCGDGQVGYSTHMYYNPDPKKVLEKQAENEGLRYIFQAYARHFFYENSVQRVPVWFIEGYGEFFSTVRFEDNVAIVGMIPEVRYKHLGMLGNGLRYKLNYKDILLQNERAGIFDRSQVEVVNEYSSKSWLLTHYILSSKDNLVRFRAYVNAVQKGQAPEPAFEAAFGFKMSGLDHRLKLYMNKGVEATRVVFKTLPEAQVTFQALPASVEKIGLMSSALKTCPDAGYGGKLLSNIEKEAASFPRDVLAELSVSEAQIRFGNPTAATPHLEAVLKASPDNAEALYLSGRVTLEAALKSQGLERQALAQKAAGQFENAAGRDPLSANKAFYLYKARLLLDEKPDDLTLSAGIYAWKQAPSVEVYALNAGLIYGYLGRKAEAIEALRSVADDPLAGPLKTPAKAWMSRLEKGASAEEISQALKTGFADEARARSQWTYATADVLLALQLKIQEQNLAADDIIPPPPE